MERVLLARTIIMTGRYGNKHAWWVRRAYSIGLIVLIALACAGCGESEAQPPVRPEHPRIWLTPGKLAVLSERAQSGSPQWERLLNHLDAPETWYRETTLAMSASLASRCLEEIDPARAATCRNLAIEQVFKVIDRGVPGSIDSYKVSVAGIAVAFDWLYDSLTDSQKERIVTYINDAFAFASKKYRHAWVNYNFDIMMISGISGYATFGDNPRAQELIDHARTLRWKYTRPALALTGPGGGWVEENGYAMETTSRLVRWMAAVKSATGEDLFGSIDFINDRLLYEMLSLYPVASNYYGKRYHKHVPTGDGRQGIGPWQYARIGRLATIEALPGSDYARYAQAWVSRPPANKMAEEWQSMWDFLFYNPDQDSLPLDDAPLACFAAGTGTVVMKGDWTPSGTQICFQGGGPHLEYHQHLDKNSFTIYKKKPLAIDAGTYDGSGDREAHVLNYYKRTIAHNSILVYRPDEYWTWQHTWQYKPGANDGGQRAMSIYTASGKRVGPWVPFNSSGVEHGDWSYDDFRMNFDCGSTPRFEHCGEFTYVMGDATRAYPAWRVSNFTRQLVYLRPRTRGGDEFIIVFDRVTSRNPDWRKYWLLHVPTEPVVRGGTESRTQEGIWEYRGADLCEVRNGDGTLYAKTLLPADPLIRKIGGPPDYDSWVFGKNYHYEEKCCYGWGRIEVIPSKPAEEDLFLHILYPALGATGAMPSAGLVDGTTVTGADIAGRVCIFSRTEESLEHGSFTLRGPGHRDVLLLDLVPNRSFHIQENGKPLTTATSSTNNLLRFGFDPGGRVDAVHTITFAADDPGRER